MAKGFIRDTSIKSDPVTVERLMGVAPDGSDIASGRDFRYEWEEYVASLDQRVSVLEFSGGGGVAPAWAAEPIGALTATVRDVRTSPAQFGGYMVYNPNDNAVYVQIFDALAADVVLGTTPAVAVFGIPAVSAANVEFTRGVTCTTAISTAATTAPGGATAAPIAITATLLYL